MRTCILTLAILVQLAAMASAQTGQPVSKAPGLPAMDSQETSIAADKKRIQDRWNSMPGTTAKKTPKATQPGNQPGQVKTTTP